METAKLAVISLLASVTSAPLLGFAQSELMGQAQAMFKPIPEYPRETAGVAMTPAMVDLGKALYFDPRLSESHNISCNNSHQKGRFQVTSTTSDEYVFKVPTLRNIELTPPYFHSGKSWDLKQAIAVMATSQLGQELNDQEVASIEAFLLALTGEQPRVTYPILPPSFVYTPRPEL
jgi:cytochrome c peroxidase